MIIEQNSWQPELGWAKDNFQLNDAKLVLVFGQTELVSEKSIVDEIKSYYPEAKIVGCSTAGEIYDTNVNVNSITTTAVKFKSTKMEFLSVELEKVNNSFEAGKYLTSNFSKEELRHIFVLADSGSINGSDLVKGLTEDLPKGVTVTGGIAGDGERFKTTKLIFDEPLAETSVIAIAFYGSNLSVGYGSVGGWDPFGPIRVVTKSEGNVLYELDGKSALDLYKTYLGPHANDLPASALLFPLNIQSRGKERAVVRTILDVNEKEQSMTFAGDVPQGAYAQLMKANFDRLIDGAVGAAEISYKSMNNNSSELAILISCVGRKMLLKQRIEEEVEGVRSVLGEKPVLTGFYSYGEISPFSTNLSCELHNQTMTITTFSEN